MKGSISGKGSTIVGAILALAIAGVVAAVTLPAVVSPKDAEMRSADDILSTLCAAEAAYYAQNGTYAKFATLRTSGFIDSRFTQDTGLVIEGVKYDGPSSDGGSSFAVKATILRTGQVLKVDQTGAVRDQRGTPSRSRSVLDSTRKLGSAGFGVENVDNLTSADG